MIIQLIFTINYQKISKLFLLELIPKLSSNNVCVCVYVCVCVCVCVFVCGGWVGVGVGVCLFPFNIKASPD